MLNGCRRCSSLFAVVGWCLVLVSLLVDVIFVRMLVV